MVMAQCYLYENRSEAVTAGDSVADAEIVAKGQEDEEDQKRPTPDQTKLDRMDGRYRT